MIKIIVAVFLLALSACAPSQSQLAYRAALDTAIAENKALFITSYGTNFPNSAGGVDLYINVVNLSSKSIKYLRYVVVPYNLVGDAQRGTIRRKSSSSIRDTGPYLSMASIPSGWSNVWYNHTIRCMTITSVKIEYMDGTSQNYGSASAVQSIMAPGLQNSCSPDIDRPMFLGDL
jgi:hypothetical protein